MLGYIASARNANSPDDGLYRPAPSEWQKLLRCCSAMCLFPLAAKELRVSMCHGGSWQEQRRISPCLMSLNQKGRRREFLPSKYKTLAKAYVRWIPRLTTADDLSPDPRARVVDQAEFGSHQFRFCK